MAGLGDALDELFKRLGEDTAGIRDPLFGVPTSTGDAAPLRASLDDAFHEIDNAIAVEEDAHGDGWERDRQRASEARTRLLYAVSVAAPPGREEPAAPEAVEAVRAELVQVEQALATWRESGTWPLTIAPSKPPRVSPQADEWEQTAEVAAADNSRVDGLLRTALKTTGGKIVMGLGAVWLARRVLR